MYSGYPGCSSNNFIKLRDIGKAVDFGVDYDAATNSVYIAPNSPYIEEVTTPAPTTPSPQAVTEESVQAALAVLKERYPTGTVYPTSGNTAHPSGRGCSCRSR